MWLCSNTASGASVSYTISLYRGAQNPPPKPPQPTPSVWTHMSRQWRCSMKNSLARTLSHPPPPPPPTPPPKPPQPTPSVWTPMSRLWRCSMKNALARTLSHPPTHPPPKPPQPTPSVWTPMSRQWRCSMKNALARRLSHPTPPPTLGLYFWLPKRSFFGCWLGPFLVADSDALARPLSHPPTHPPRNPPNQHPASEHLCHVNEDVPWRTH